MYVAQHGVMTVAAHDQAHRYASDGFLYGYARVHQRQVVPQTLPIDVLPFELSTSETTRMV